MSGTPWDAFVDRLMGTASMKWRKGTVYTGNGQELPLEFGRGRVVLIEDPPGQWEPWLGRPVGIALNDEGIGFALRARFGAEGAMLPPGSAWTLDTGALLHCSALVLEKAMAWMFIPQPVRGASVVLDCPAYESWAERWEKVQGPGMEGHLPVSWPSCNWSAVCGMGGEGRRLSAGIANFGRAPLPLPNGRLLGWLALAVKSKMLAETFKYFANLAMRMEFRAERESWAAA
ncbi:MAG: hypothetical protein LBW85_09675 [Deltaproteobacteria bacterium]|jgi:hypothetical protein|nr:hypothetical protein [Deltaproteobacteria bacterium]